MSKLRNKEQYLKDNSNTRILSARYTSSKLNNEKLKYFNNLEEHVILLKNEMSKYCFEHLSDLLFGERKEFIKIVSDFTKHTNLSYWTVQDLFYSVIETYDTKFKILCGNADCGVSNGKIKVSYYKKNVVRGEKLLHKRGEVKDITQDKHYTALGKLIKYLLKQNFRKDIHIPKSITSIYEYYYKKFGERIINLANSKQDTVLCKFEKPHVFTTGSFRVPNYYGTSKHINEFFIDDTNSEYKHWFKFTNKQTRIYLPIDINEEYHNYSKIRGQSFIIKFNSDKKDRVDIITSINGETPQFKEYENTIGIDLNAKHNFCYMSNGHSVDYDRQYIKDFVTELKKLDVIGLKNISETQRNHLNKLVRRNEWYFKKLISEILDYLENHNITDIVIEDLNKLPATFIKNKEFEIKYSRLVRLLRLSNIKNWLLSQAEKRGIRVHITPPHYTSKMCPICGTISDDNRTTQENFECIHCGHKDNADHNASINILQRLMNVSLATKLHNKDEFHRLTPKLFISKYEILNILNTEYKGNST